MAWRGVTRPSKIRWISHSHFSSWPGSPMVSEMTGEYSGVGIITKGKGRPACPRKAPAESPPLPYRGIKNPDNRYCFLISAVQLLSSFPKLPAFLRNWASARPPRSMIGPQMTAISAIINTMAELRPHVKSSSQEFQPISCAWFRYPVVLRSTLPSPDLHDGGDTGLAARGLLLLLRDAGPSFLPRGVSMESWLPHVGLQTRHAGAPSPAVRQVV
eukprot:g66415.t1